VGYTMINNNGNYECPVLAPYGVFIERIPANNVDLDRCQEAMQ